MLIRRSSAYRRRTRETRSGSACVEAALCLPIVFLMTLATIDICSALFLKESITLAAYEGARVGVARGKTNADAQARITEFLTERGVNLSGSTVVISAPGFANANALDNITVTVTVPSSGNLIAPGRLFLGKSFTASVTMRKEFENN